MRKLEKITGLRATKGKGYYQLEIMPAVALFSFKAEEKAACDELREKNWTRIVRLVCESQGWRCGRCGVVGRPLQGHHIKHRSLWRPLDGPLDCEANVIALDSDCHGKEHGT